MAKKVTVSLLDELHGKASDESDRAEYATEDKVLSGHCLNSGREIRGSGSTYSSRSAAGRKVAGLINQVELPGSGSSRQVLFLRTYLVEDDVQKWFSGVVNITPSGRPESRLPSQNLHKVPTEKGAGAKARLFFALYGTTKVVP